MGEVRATPMFLQNSRASPAELAEQLTLLEHELLTTIDPSELLKQEWATGDSAKAPGVLLYINWFNQVRDNRCKREHEAHTYARDSIVRHSHPRRWPPVSASRSYRNRPIRDVHC